MAQDWNSDKAGAELKALFDRVDEICSKPIYQEVSADEPQTPSADLNPTTEQQSQGLTQL